MDRIKSMNILVPHFQFGGDMNIRSRLLILILASILAFSLVGCQSQAQGPVSIKVLAMEQAGPTVDEMNAIVQEFNKANPNIKVEIEYVAYDALHDKITTAMASSPPAYDVFLVDDIWYAEFAKAGYVADVSTKITQDMRDKIFKASWDITTVSNKVYGMPWLLDEKYFFYNEKLLNQAGFTAPPKTWEELLDQAKAIKDQGIVEFPIVWSWGQYEAAICDWVTLLYANGGSMVDEQGKPAFNSDIGVKTLEWMVKTIDDGLTNPSSVSSDENAVRDNFIAGKSAFAVNWLNQYSDSNDATKSQIASQAAFAPMPVFDSGAKAGIKGSSVDGSSSFAIMATTPYPDQTWKFLTYFTSNEVQTKFSKEMLPIWKTDFEGDKLSQLQNATPTNPVTVPAFLGQFPYANERPTGENPNRPAATRQ